MKILIDGDGCPVVDLSLKLGLEAGCDVIIFCDSSHHFEKAGAKVVMVMKGRDAVDFELVKYVEKGDIVVTQDYGLAAMALAKGGRPVTQNGLIFTADNVELMLESRHQSLKARKAKIRLKGPKKRTKEDDELFRTALEKLIFVKSP